MITEGSTFGRGVEQGVERGILQEKQNVLVMLLEQKFGPLSAGVRERIEALRDPERLDHLLGRILAAGSLDQMGLDSLGLDGQQ